MNRTISFAKRNFIEMSRDALSYIFCIAFPIVMLVIMSVVNSSIPKEGMTLFRIDNLAGGIAIFGQTFVMLFTAIGIAKDRSGSFLVRLFASPMKSKNFTAGYLLPMILVAYIQVVISFAASFIVSLIVGYDISIAGLIIASFAVLPSAVMFASIGFLFGTLFNEKSAPGICSIIISLGSFVGGIWFDVDGAGGIMEKISKCMPFYYATKLTRSAIDMNFSKDGFLIPMIVVVGSAVLMTLLAVFAFGRKMRADLS